MEEWLRRITQPWQRMFGEMARSWGRLRMPSCSPHSSREPSPTTISRCATAGPIGGLYELCLLLLAPRRKSHDPLPSQQVQQNNRCGQADPLIGISSFLGSLRSCLSEPARFVFGSTSTAAPTHCCSFPTESPFSFYSTFTSAEHGSVTL